MPSASKAVMYSLLRNCRSERDGPTTRDRPVRRLGRGQVDRDETAGGALVDRRRFLGLFGSAASPLQRLTLRRNATLTAGVIAHRTSAWTRAGVPIGSVERYGLLSTGAALTVDGPLPAQPSDSDNGGASVRGATLV